MTSPPLYATDDNSALEMLHDLGCTDGLPVVVPTPERVERMVIASGLDADIAVGSIGPLHGSATIEKIAANAVMAGCLPDHLPVLLAAVRAVCRPELDTSEWQSTTHAISPLVIVHGEAATSSGVVGGFGALGPGHRANASIGRALRLVLINIGGARPGVSDMALLGHPGKFTMCLAEDATTGLGALCGEAAVTVVGTEGPHSVLSVGDADDSAAPGRLLDSLAASVANVGSNNAYFRRGSVAIALNPDHAAALHAAGLRLASIATAVCERAVNRRGTLRSLNPTFAGSGGDDDLIRAVADPKDVLVFVAGGPGLYSMVFPSWGAGPHANPWVREQVVLDQSCEMPPATANWR